MRPALLRHTLARAYENSLLHRAVFQLQSRLQHADDGEVLVRDAAQYWGESRAHTQRQELSHWRGVGRWSDELQWLAVGQEHRALIEAFCGAQGRPIAGATLLEWGPGGGTNVLAFLPDARRIYGVDISQSNLDECRRQCAGEHSARFVAVLLDGAAPESIADTVTEPLDLVYSTAVFQHFPSKAYGERVLRVLAKRMAPGACAMIQIRYDDGRVKYLSKSRGYRKHAVTFTSYAIPEFWRLLEQTGFKPAHVTLQPRNNYAFYYFTRS